MATQPGVAERMFRALAERGINIIMITTSEIKISVLVAREYALEALRTVHERVPIGQGAARPPRGAAGRGRRESSLTEIVARMEKMEGLIIEDVSLDESQARVTVLGLPDIPGLAAQVFDEIAEAGIVVDMIVQSVGRQGHANISFTVPQEELDKSLRVASEQAESLGCPPPLQLPQGGQALRLRRGHEEPHERRQPPLPVAGRRGDQRRSDQHHGGPHQRHGRRPARREGPGGALAGIRR